MSDIFIDFSENETVVDIGNNSTVVEVNKNNLDLSIGDDNFEITFDGLVDGTLLPSDFYNKIALIDSYNYNKNNAYTEYTSSGGKITSIDIWEDNTKLTKLFTKTFTYIGDLVSNILLTNEVSGNTLSKSFAYSGTTLLNKTEVLL